MTNRPSFRAWVFLAKTEPGNIIVARYPDGSHKVCVVESRLDEIAALSVPNAVRSRINLIYSDSPRDLSFGMNVRSRGCITNNAVTVNDQINVYWSFIKKRLPMCETTAKKLTLRVVMVGRAPEILLTVTQIDRIMRSIFFVEVFS